MSLRTLGVGARLAMLSLAFAAATPVVGFFALQNGAQSWTTTLIAAAIVYGAGVLAMILAALAPNPQQAVATALGGSLARVGVCLIAGIGLHESSPALARDGVFGQIMAFYLVGLLVETPLIATMTAGGSTAMTFEKTEQSAKNDPSKPNASR